MHNKFIKSQTGAGSVLVVLGGAAPQEIKRRSIMAHAGNRKLAGSRYRRTTAAASQKDEALETETQNSAAKVGNCLAAPDKMLLIATQLTVNNYYFGP